jgi:hypothetical protein
LVIEKVVADLVRCTALAENGLRHIAASAYKRSSKVKVSEKKTSTFKHKEGEVFLYQ